MSAPELRAHIRYPFTGLLELHWVVRVKNGTEMTLTTIRLQLSLLPGRINVPILLSSKDGLCLRLMSLVQATKDPGDPGERTSEIRIQRGKGAVRSVHHWSCRYLTMATSQALD